MFPARSALSFPRSAVHLLSLQLASEPNSGGWPFRCLAANRGIWPQSCEEDWHHLTESEPLVPDETPGYIMPECHTSFPSTRALPVPELDSTMSAASA